VNRTVKSSELKRTVKASEFKARCLALIDEVARTGQSVVITKRGEPMADLVPHRLTQRNARGIWKGKVDILGDITAPMDVEWDALK
jgi:prevent-host-death family protein